MPGRQEFLTYLWTDCINPNLKEETLDSLIKHSKHEPSTPFADAGVIVQRMLEAGVSRKDICRFAQYVAYETSFNLLYALDDPGLDDADVSLLHESLLSADPSGREGRPQI